MAAEYEEAPRQQLYWYRTIVEKLRELEEVSLRFRYVFGGPTYFRGLFFYYTKLESDTILPDDHNSLVDFYKKFLEFIALFLGGVA